MYCPSPQFSKWFKIVSKFHKFGITFKKLIFQQHLILVVVVVAHIFHTICMSCWCCSQLYSSEAGKRAHYDTHDLRAESQQETNKKPAGNRHETTKKPASNQQ